MEKKPSWDLQLKRMSGSFGSSRILSRCFLRILGELKMSCWKRMLTLLSILALYNHEEDLNPLFLTLRGGFSGSFHSLWPITTGIHSTKLSKPSSAAAVIFSRCHCLGPALQPLIFPVSWHSRQPQTGLSLRSALAWSHPQHSPFVLTPCQQTNNQLWRKQVSSLISTSAFQVLHPQCLNPVWHIPEGAGLRQGNTQLQAQAAAGRGCVLCRFPACMALGLGAPTARMGHSCEI